MEIILIKLYFLKRKNEMKSDYFYETIEKWMEYNYENNETKIGNDDISGFFLYFKKKEYE